MLQRVLYPENGNLKALVWALIITAGIFGGFAALAFSVIWAAQVHTGLLVAIVITHVVAFLITATFANCGVSNADDQKTNDRLAEKIGLYDLVGCFLLASVIRLLTVIV